MVPLRQLKLKQANVKHYIMVYDARREAFDPSGDLKPYTIALC